MSPCPQIPFRQKLVQCALLAFGLAFFVIVAHLLGIYFLELETRTTLSEITYSYRVFLMVFVLSFLYMVCAEMIKRKKE